MDAPPSELKRYLQSQLQNYIFVMILSVAYRYYYTVNLPSSAVHRVFHGPPNQPVKEIHSLFFIGWLPNPTSFP